MGLTFPEITKRQYLACLLFQLLATLPIFLFVPPYIDDLGRSRTGYLFWTYDGRPLADVLTAILNNGSHLALASPLLQLLSVVVLALAGALLASSYQIRRPWLSAACSLPLAAQPYFLENLSYGFDSISMSCALLLAIVGGLVIKENPKPISLASSIPLGIGSLSLYQPAFHSLAIVAILGSVFMDCHAETKRNKDNLLGSMYLTFLSYAASLAIYKLVVIDMLFNAKYMSYRGQALGMGLHLPFALRNRIGEFWSLLASDWAGTLLGVVALGVLISYIATLIWSPGSGGHSSRGRVIRPLAVVTVILTVYGPSLLLLRPLMTQPRTMVGLGVLFSCILMHLLQMVPSANHQSKAGRALGLWSRILIIVFAYALVVNAYSYAAAFRAQNEYEMSVLSRLAYDIDKHAELAESNDGLRVGFIGAAPSCPILKNSQERYPYLKRIIPILINGNWVWGGIKLSHITGYPINQLQLESPEALSARITDTGMKPVFKSPLYEGFYIDNALVIRFKPTT